MYSDDFYCDWRFDNIHELRKEFGVEVTVENEHDFEQFCKDRFKEWLRDERYGW